MYCTCTCITSTHWSSHTKLTTLSGTCPVDSHSLQTYRVSPKPLHGTTNSFVQTFHHRSSLHSTRLHSTISITRATPSYMKILTEKLSPIDRSRSTTSADCLNKIMASVLAFQLYCEEKFFFNGKGAQA